MTIRVLIARLVIFHLFVTKCYLDELITTGTVPEDELAPMQLARLHQISPS